MPHSLHLPLNTYISPLTSWQHLLLASATTKEAAFTAVAVGSLSAVAWPAVIALQSSRANPEEGGAVAGVLQVGGRCGLSGWRVVREVDASSKEAKYTLSQ